MTTDQGPYPAQYPVQFAYILALPRQMLVEKIGHAFHWLLHQPNSLRQRPESQPTGYRHLSSPRMRRKHSGILPIVHPADHDRSVTTPRSIERQRAVAILAVVGPERGGRRILVHEARAVESPDEILFP